MADLRAGRVLAYWRAERRTIRQGMVALGVASFGNLVAGLTFGAMTGTLERLPGLVVLIPAAIGMRGNIFGALGSRLGTTIHAGSFESSRRRGSVMQQNVLAVTILTFTVSVLLGVLAKAISEAFGVEAISVADLVAISIVGGLVSSVFVGGFTALIAVQAHHRGWDLDSVHAPLVTAIGDIVTLPALFLATFMLDVPYLTPIVAVTSAAAASWVSLRGLTIDLPVTRRIVRESLPILVLAGTVDVLAGLTIEARLDSLIAFPALLVVVPPLLADAGALGATLASRLGSKLHLGALEPRALPQGLALLDTSIVLLFAIWIFALLGLAADVVAGLAGLASPGAVDVVLVTLVAGTAASLFAVGLAYYAAIATYRIGMDPDNHGIPIITSSMDLIGTLCFVLTLVAFGLA